MITTQHCAECERLALLDDLHKGLEEYRKQQKTASEITCEEQDWQDWLKIVVRGYWNMISDLQRRQHVHTCKGVGDE